MKVRADENVSPKIVQAVRLLCLKEGWEFSHVRDDNAARTQDETWLRKFAAEGGKAILTGDSRIFSRPHQLLAIRQTGLVSMVLDGRWTQAKKHEQAALIIYWWPRIEGALMESQAGDCWPVPFVFNARMLERKAIDFEKAGRAARASGN